MDTLKIRDIILEAGRPKVAIPVISSDPKDIIAECERIKDMPCELVEWRADKYLGRINDLETALDDKEFYLDIVKILDDMNFIVGDKPVIFTVRSKEQGGDVSVKSRDIAQLQVLAAQSGLADLIDIELFDENGMVDDESLKARIEEIHGYGSKVIMSHHDFKKMPEGNDIVSIVKIMKGLGADICKVAGMAGSKEDAAEMLKTTAFMRKKHMGPLIMIAMGDQGKPVRVAAGRYGSCVTFAAGSGESAPGQVDAYTMKKWLDDYYGERKK